MNFIEDKELENLDKFDLLDAKKYAITLQRIIENSKTPLTIGVFGEWGSGKSSIINTVKNNIDNNKIKFIVYDAWKYNRDSFRRMFLKELARQLKLKMNEKFESFYVDKNESLEVLKGINWKLIFVIILGIAILIDLLKFKNVETAIVLTFIATIIGIVGKDMFNKYSITINHIRLFAPEQFEEIYYEIIKSIFETSFNPIKWVKEKINGKIEKIIIVIDNLDRCDDNTIYELLTTIKTFLQKENVIFIIPIDDLRLKKFLSENHKLNEKEADEFLRKIFDVTLKIKHFKPLDMFHFTNKLNIKYELNLQPDTIDIFAKEYATNPRRIIQLINNLLVEKNILKNKIDIDFANKYESLIAKILIIREEWPDFYKKLLFEPKLINQLEKDKVKNLELNNFLKRTIGYSINIEDLVIEKIISNIDNDFNIDSKIIAKLYNHNYEEINIEEIDYNLFNYILDELLKEINNKTFKGGSLNRFKNLIKINSKKELPLNFIKRFDSDFEVGDIIKIIKNLDSDYFDDLFKFVNLLHKNNYNQLLNELVKKYQEIWKEDYNKDEIEQLPKIWNYGLDYLINNIEDEKIIQLLQDVFVYFYDYYSESPLYKDENKWLQEDKIKHILSQKLIDYLIDKVDKKFENDAYKELLYFAKLGLLDIKQIENIFNKLKWTDRNNFNNEAEAKQECILDLINKIANLNKLLSKLQPVKFKSDVILQTLQKINTISKNYILGRSYEVKINLINELKDKKQQKELLYFYMNIYKDTINNTNVVSYITKIVDKYRNLEVVLYQVLLNFHNNYKFNLPPFIEYLLSKNSLDENLLKIYLNYIKNEEILKEYNGNIKTKLLKILQNYDDKIEWFFDEILDSKILKISLIDLLETDFDNFEKLPIKLKKLAFEYICENKKINQFENDIAVLKEFAKENYYDCLMNILVKKLGDEKIDEVIKILDQFEVIPINLWKNLALLEKYKEQEEYKESFINLEKKVK